MLKKLKIEINITKHVNNVYIIKYLHRKVLRPVYIKTGLCHGFWNQLMT